MLSKVKLTDPDGRVSLTNLASYVVLFVLVYSVVHSGTLDINALGALLTTMGAQRAKMWQQDKRESREFTALHSRLEATKAELADVKREYERAAKAPSARTTVAPTLPAGLR